LQTFPGDLSELLVQALVFVEPEMRQEKFAEIKG